MKTKVSQLRLMLMKMVTTTLPIIIMAMFMSMTIIMIMNTLPASAAFMPLIQALLTITGIIQIITGTLTIHTTGV